jgi:hypothetical protein
MFRIRKSSMRVRALVNLFLVIVFFITFSLNAQSFGISFQYMENDTLGLYPGQSYLFKLTVQNKDPDDMNVSVELNSAIATIVGSPELFIPGKTFDKYILFNITVPEDAQAGGAYNITYKVYPLSSGTGQIPLSVAYDRSFRVLVVEKPKQEPAEEQKPAPSTSPPVPEQKPGILKWIFIPILLIVVIIIAALLWNKSHQMSNRIMRGQQEFRPQHTAQSIVLQKPEPAPEVITPPRPPTQPLQTSYALPEIKLTEQLAEQPEQKTLPLPVPVKQEKVISPHHYFHLRNGQSLKNLAELYPAIRSMSDDEFKHHVNPAKNDFANWIYHILEKQELANRLFRKTTKQETLELIKDELEKK